MKKVLSFIAALLTALMFTGCAKHTIIIWTGGEIVGLVILGLLIIGCGIYVFVLWLNSLFRKLKRTREKNRKELAALDLFMKLK